MWLQVLLSVVVVMSGCSSYSDSANLKDQRIVDGLNAKMYQVANSEDEAFYCMRECREIDPNTKVCSATEKYDQVSIAAKLEKKISTSLPTRNWQVEQIEELESLIASYSAGRERKKLEIYLKNLKTKKMFFDQIRNEDVQVHFGSDLYRAIRGAFVERGPRSLNFKRGDAIKFHWKTSPLYGLSYYYDSGQTRDGWYMKPKDGQEQTFDEMIFATSLGSREMSDAILETATITEVNTDQRAIVVKFYIIHNFHRVEGVAKFAEHHVDLMNDFVGIQNQSPVCTFREKN